MAVSLVCRLEETKMREGLVGFVLFDSLKEWLVHEGHTWTDTWHSRRTDLTLGQKLYNPIWLIPSQSARSLALARAVDRPIVRRLCSV